MLRLLRMLGIVLAMLMAIGFGLCGVYGVVTGATGLFTPGDRTGWPVVFILPGLIGLGICAGCLQLVWNTLHGQPSDGAPPAQ